MQSATIRLTSGWLLRTAICEFTNKKTRRKSAGPGGAEARSNQNEKHEHRLSDVMVAKSFSRCNAKRCRENTTLQITTRDNMAARKISFVNDNGRATDARVHASAGRRSPTHKDMNYSDLPHNF